MQKSFGFVDQQHAGITGHDFCDDASESFDTVARLVNKLSGRVKPDGVRMNTSLLHVVSWSSIGEPNAQVS